MKGKRVEMRLEELTESNFSERSLDAFVRRQEVTQCWRKTGGEWRLLPICFTEDWDLAALAQAEPCDVQMEYLLKPAAK